MCKSFTKAAETLGLTQPDVSLQIKSLEKEYGTKLFEKIGKEIFLTDSGKILMVYAEKILSTMESKFTEKPLVLFFPGKYETDNVKGSNLTLFGILDDKYYRAFNIYHCEP